MTRRCSHCGHNGHNARTCPNRGVKIFGVRLDGPIRKSASMGNLSHYGRGGSNGGGSPAVADGVEERERDGYVSEDFVNGSSSSVRERKKGVAWTEEEHKMFLRGLQKVGKGDWRGISKNFVVSRTPTQVASHAQKYFIRQMHANRRKRRSSLFDMVPDEPFPGGSQDAEAQSSNAVQRPPPLDEENESLDSNSSNPLPAPPPFDAQPLSVDVGRAIPKPENMQYPYAVMCGPYLPFFPFSYPFWPYYRADAMENKAHEVLKPIAVHSKAPINVDELVVMSKLSLGETVGKMSSSTLTLNLLGGSERHSAFHANNPSTSGGGSSMNSSSSPIHAI